MDGQLVGKVIACIEWANEGEQEIDRIVFTDGSALSFDGSGQIGVNTVWAYYEPAPR